MLYGRFILLYRNVNSVNSDKVVCREPFVYTMSITGENCVEKTNGREVPTGGEPAKILIICYVENSYGNRNSTFVVGVVFKNNIVKTQTYVKPHGKNIGIYFVLFV